MNKNIKLLTILLIPISIGIQIQASAATSETIIITNATNSPIWVSNQNDLGNPVEIKNGKSANILLSKPGIFAYIANQELPFTAIGKIETTLAITYFKNNSTFYIYNQNFIVKDDLKIDFFNPGMADPLNKKKFGSNQISGNHIYIHHNGFRTATGLIATDSPIDPFQTLA